MQNKILSKNAKRLVVTHVIFTSAGAISGTFVFIFLWRIKNDLSYIAYFELMSVLLMMFGYILSGLLLTVAKSKTIFRYSFLTLILSHFIILILQEKVIDYILIIGILQGLGSGLYWGTYNLMQLRETEDKSREYFLGAYSGGLTFLSTLFPVFVGGLITLSVKYTNIELGGYYLLYAFSIMLLLILYGYVESLPSINLKYFQIGKIINTTNSKMFRVFSLYELLSGIYETGLKLIFLIFSYRLLTTELNMGILTSVFGAISGLYIFFIGKHINIGKRPLWVLIGSIFIMIGRYIFIIFLTVPAIIVDRVLSTIGSPLFGLPSTAIILSAIENRTELIIERQEQYLVAREIPLGFGRFFGILFFIVFIYIFGQNNLFMIKTWFILISSLTIIQWFILNKIHYKYVKPVIISTPEADIL